MMAGTSMVNSLTLGHGGTQVSFDVPTFSMISSSFTLYLLIIAVRSVLFSQKEVYF
jgi:hypothetical protein